MEALLFPILIILAGAFFLVRNVILLRDDAKLLSYVQTSPKAKLWVRKYGIDRTVEMSKKYFLPLGLLVSATLLAVGIWSLVRVLQI